MGEMESRAACFAAWQANASAPMLTFVDDERGCGLGCRFLRLTAAAESVTEEADEASAATGAFEDQDGTDAGSRILRVARQHAEPGCPWRA